MSNDIFIYYCAVNNNSSGALEGNNSHGVSGNLTNSKSILSKASISAIILTMCICGRIVASNAELSGKLIKS